MAKPNDNKPLVDEAVAALQTDSIAPFPTESITIQLPRDIKERHEKFARLTGHIRTDKKTGKIVGNMSWASGQADEFFYRHLDLYMAEKADELAKALEA